MRRELELQIACDRAHELLMKVTDELVTIENLSDSRNILPGMALTLLSQVVECVATLKPVPTTLAKD